MLKKVVLLLASLLIMHANATCESDLIAVFEEKSYINANVSQSMIWASGGGPNDVGNYEVCRSIVGAQYCLGQEEMGSSLNLISFGLCAPVSCTPGDVKEYLQAVGGMGATVEVRCGDNRVESLDTAAILFIITMVILTGLLGWGTWVEYDLSRSPPASSSSSAPKASKTEADLEAEMSLVEEVVAPPQPTKSQKLIMSFSLISNWETLCGRSAGRKYACLDGLRAISLLWIIMAHTFNFIFMVGVDNPIPAWKEILHHWSFNFLLGANFAVDTFFFLSGFLSTYVTLRKFARSKGGGFPVHLAVLHRYLRLTPCLAFVIFCFIGLPKYLASGPHWHKFSSMTSDCKDNWWPSLLYINNFYPSVYMKQCLPWTWYLPNDMQFFVVGMLLLLLYRRVPRVTVALVLSLIVGCIGVNVGLNTHYDFYDGKGDAQNNQYDKPYARLAPYLVGMLTAFGFNTHREAMKFSRSVTAGLLLLSVGLIYTAILINATNDDKQWSEWQFVLNDSTVRTYFSVGLAGLTLLLLTGHVPLLDMFLSSRAWDPVAKLSYAMYLLHPIVIRFFYFSNTQLIHFSIPHTVVMWAGVVVITGVVAAVVHLLVELPFATLERLVLFGK